MESTTDMLNVPSILSSNEKKDKIIKRNGHSHRLKGVECSISIFEPTESKELKCQMQDPRG
jgi:hypothetical protein